MKKQLVVAIAATSTVLLCTLGSSSGANAYDYCRRDVTGHMTSCSFDTMQQCEATRSGIGGDCFRDPFIKNHLAAYARGTTHPGSRRAIAAGRPQPATSHRIIEHTKLEGRRP